MASIVADLQSNLVATPQIKSKVNRFNGRIRIFQANAIVPATNGPIVGETITWGGLPRGARPLGYLGQLNFSAGAASSTLNLGDAASAARHLAATAVNAAGVATPNAANANGAQFECTDDTNAATNNCTLISTVAGAPLQAGQVITLTMPYVQD